MIRLFEAQNFRMLRGNRVALRPFAVLVGQNATGKSTLLGALQLVSDALKLGVPEAVRKLLGSRAASFRDLCFDAHQPIAFAFEVEVPRSERTTPRLRYEIEMGNGDQGLRVLREQLFVMPETESKPPELQPSLFAMDPTVTPVIQDKGPKGWRKVVGKNSEGRDYFKDEKTEWNNTFRFGPERPALGSLPQDPERFPLSIAVRDLLRDGIHTVALDAARLRGSSPPGSPTKLALDGSNLPDVARDLLTRDQVLYRQWVRHVATGVSGLEDVDVFERPEDKHLVLRAQFTGSHGDPVPSWLLSDGTLRLMALTLLSFASTESTSDIYLIEEPENGLHPLAMQTMLEALSQPPGGGMQVLLASHSPILLANLRLEDVLVFRRQRDGAALVRRGEEVPELRDWKGRAN
ncbi:MAG: ATP-binding protein, partial [Myxococcales bacterium]|nr:ATP-binding protein [Myxococcales bacterium]